MMHAEVICHSKNTSGKELVTFLVRYPRFIHAEFLRHRSLSFCCASSRAIPTKKILYSIIRKPVFPIHWGQNRPGMQAVDELPVWKQYAASFVWSLSCLSSIIASYLLSKIGVHKQITNRVTEPYQYMTHIVSGTEWGNFFNLRCHKDAQPEFRELATLMLKAYMLSKPKLLLPGEWHLPFGDKYADGLSNDDKLKVCTARCARTSYLNFDGDFSYEKDFKLHDDLLSSKHFSPFEFCAVAMDSNVQSGNYIGFKQYRKFLHGENQSSFDITKLIGE